MTLNPINPFRAVFSSFACLVSSALCSICPSQTKRQKQPNKTRHPPRAPKTRHPPQARQKYKQHLHRLLPCSAPAPTTRHRSVDIPPPFRHLAYPQKGVTGILQQIARVCGHLASISVWRWLVQNSRACARCLRSCSCLCERMISVFVQHRHAGGSRVTQRCSLRGVSRILTPKTAGSMRSANMLCSDAAYASARF